MMMNVIKVLISIAVISLICVLINLTNTKKNRRIRQLPIVGASLALMIIGIIQWNSHAKVIEFVVSIASFFFSANLLFLNLSLMIAFLLLKLIIKPIFVSVFKNYSILKVFSLCFYEYDEEYDEWFLKKQWVKFRTYCLAIVCGLIGASGLYLGLTWVFGSTHSIWMFVFPCAAIVVFNEFYGYINGQTKEEFEHLVNGDDADARKISNYFKLREVYEEILPEPLLSAHTGCEFQRRETPADMIIALKASDSFADNITATFFEVNDRYKKADTDCFLATLKMMHNRNVVFFNPFYKDLGIYISLPLMQSLMAGKKCTVICGRRNIADDVENWITDIIVGYTHTKSLWRVGKLGNTTPDLEVGIITFDQIYDNQVINVNDIFFKNTGMVIMLEPSIMLFTSQVALNIMAGAFNAQKKKPVYCIFDRYTDGLVDTLSHILYSEILDVVAMPVPRTNYTALSWNADGDFCRQQLFDKQTRYLGNGIELSAIAIKNQIPDVVWYGEKKAPVKDIKWIAGQNYSTICSYMNQPTQQKSLYEKIKFESNLWSAPRTKEQFVISEDEFCNMFSMMRAYLSRGENQVFVNVLSENYLLRDYMRCNMRMFLTNPNTVPSLVPDYAKTERNVIIKLILMMSLKPVYEDEIEKEFNIANIRSDDVYGTLLKLIKIHTTAKDSLIDVKSIRKDVDEFSVINQNVYSITTEEFNKYFYATLNNAYYIVEDELKEKEYIDAKFFNHVLQTVMPGQFVSYDGKYYQVKHISPQSGVVLRRASDLYDGRKYYRQNRLYHFDFASNSEILSTKKIMDIEFTEIRTDFSVDTTGYLVMNDYHDLRTARLVDLSDDPCVEDFKRSYRNKSVLRIKLPETDENICFTICLMLTELFRSVYPDGWQYITAVTKCPEDVEGMLNYVVYPVEGELETGYIYIVEDSDIDLGLLDSVGKNFMRLMEVITDFLDWHFEKMKEKPSEDPVPKKIEAIEIEEKKKRGLLVRLFERIRKIFGGKKEKPVKIADIKDKEKDKSKDKSKEKQRDKDREKDIEKTKDKDSGTEDIKDNAPETEDIKDVVPETGDIKDAVPETEDFEKPESVAPVKEADAEEKTDKEDKEKDEKEKPVVAKVPPETKDISETDFEPEGREDPELVHIDGTDIFDTEGKPWDDEYFDAEFERLGITPITKSRYQRECFLKYGFEEIDDRIKIKDLRDYLRVRGWSNNSLTLARKREVFAWSPIDLDAVEQCDFCGQPLSGVSYEKLNDGRIRCNDCSATAITSVDEFRELFRRCLEWMEGFYDINFRIPINIKMTDAKEIARGVGMIFRPTKGYTARTLGFAQKKRNKYSILIENGSPRLATIDTLVHEMTHIWQYLNWNDEQVLSIYKMKKSVCTEKARLIIYEGMAMWSAIQCLYLIGETYYASVAELNAARRPDVYGIGFRLFRDQYPLIKDSSMPHYTPFKSFPPLAPEDVYAALKATCEFEEDCIC